MKAVLEIIWESGGFDPGKSISIENEPWMRLAIEMLQESGPDGHLVISVAHYGVQNSDLMRDPETLRGRRERRRDRTDSAVFPQRLCGRRAVEPVSRRIWRSGLPARAHPRDGSFREDVGPESQRAGLSSGVPPKIRRGLARRETI